MRGLVVGAAMIGSFVVGDEGLSCLGTEDGAQQERPMVVWRLPDGPGTAGVNVRSCGDVLATAAGLQGTPGAGCEVQAWRKDGLLEVTSPWFPVPEHSARLDFGMADGALGGMGARISATQHGVRVLEVLRGTPAERAGLERGDVIAVVDGASTAFMDTEAFVRRAVGRPGTELQLEIAGEVVVVERAPIR